MIGVVTKIFRNNPNEPRKDKGGYFFVRGDDGHDRFAHARDVGQDIFPQLSEGTKVEFKPLSGGPRGNGLRAEEVVLL